MTNFFKAFVYAFNGLATFFRHERNGRIQLVIGIVAVALSFILRISQQEWCWILLCIAIVISLEMMNSSIEKLCDLIQPEFNTTIKIIKDMCAGAVLWASIVSAIIGAIIFLPKIF